MKYKMLMFANVLIWGALGVRRFMLGDIFQGVVGVGLAIFFFVFALRTEVLSPEEAMKQAEERAEAQKKAAADKAAAVDAEFTEEPKE